MNPGVVAGSSILDSNLGNLPGSIVAVLIPAVVLLVSGTIGFRGLANMAGGDITLGLQQFMQMFIVAMTIFAGMLIGFTIVRPEKTL